MNDVIVLKRRRNWEWQVREQNGRLIMTGRERSRPAARYQGYRALFMLLSIGQRAASARKPEAVPGPETLGSRGRKSEPSSARPKTDQSR